MTLEENIYPWVCRSKIAVPGMVDNFEKSYGALQISYPGDQGKLAEIDAQKLEQEAEYKA